MPFSKTALRKTVMAGAYYSGLSTILGRFNAGIGCILMLHRVGPPPHASGLNGSLSVSAEFLDRVLDSLRHDGWRLVSMDEAVDRLRSGHHDERFAAVTLDDGYRDNLMAGLPVFRAHDVPFTIYVCPGLAEARAFLWWEVIAEIVDRYDRVSFVTDQGSQVLDSASAGEKQGAYAQLTNYVETVLDEDGQRRFVLELAKAYGVDVEAHCREAIMDWRSLRRICDDTLCTIGAHTINHFNLSRLDEKRAAFEIEQSGNVIEVELGVRPAHFAFPYGGPAAAGEREVRLARQAGYTTAVTTRHGLLHPEHGKHLHCLPRLSVNGLYQRERYLRTMLSGVTVPLANRGRRFVTL